MINCRTLPTTKDPARPGLRYWRFGPDPFDPALRDAPGGVPVEEGRLIANERLGTSDGTPNQRFPLAHPRLILRPIGQGQSRSQDLILLVEHGSTVERWNRRESLAFSRTGTLSGELEPQNDFVVKVDEDDRATVIFGDGQFGAIPPRDAVIKATYRIGGGTAGNVAARAITTIVNAPPLALLAAKIVNVKPATGGAERESIEHAVLQAPSVFRARKRAVTQGDYEALARSFRGVGKVRAEATHWNSVTLYVAPEGGGQVSDTLRANLLAYFEDKRPITTRMEIAGADYAPIYLIVRIGTESYYDPENVKARVLAAAGRILAFDNVDFGQTIYLSKFYEAIESVEGVRDVFISQFTRDSTKPDEIETNGQIKLGPNEIPQLPEAGIRVVGL